MKTAVRITELTAVLSKRLLYLAVKWPLLNIQLAIVAPLPSLVF